MLAALRDGTREQHVDLERRLDLPGRVRTRADLRAVLAAMLASWAPLERELAAADWSGLRLDARLGAATGLLRADLASLTPAGQPDPIGQPGPIGGPALPGDAGVGRAAPGSAGDAGAGAEAAEPVRFGSLARAVGGRYVLLGSALGGSVIAPAVERRLGLAEGEATRFFRRAGLVPGRDWREFRLALANRDWSPGELREATDAARETFTFVGRAAAPVLAGHRPGR